MQISSLHTQYIPKVAHIIFLKGLYVLYT